MTANVDSEALAALAAAELPADLLRRAYIARHIDAVREAVQEGVERWYANLIAAHRAKGAA